MRPRKATAVAVIGLLALLVGSASAVQRRSHILWSGAAGDTTSLWTADSSSIVYTGDCERWYLLIKPDGPCRVAIQVRSHGDSITNSNATVLADSVRTYTWPWGPSVATTADTMSYRRLKGTQFVAGTEEFVVSFADDNTLFYGYPRGVVIPLRGRDGEWYWGPNTSIRLRVMGPAVGAGGRLVKWDHVVLQGVSF